MLGELKPKGPKGIGPMGFPFRQPIESGSTSIYPPFECMYYHGMDYTNKRLEKT
jgi:hypothetical protein